MTFRIDSKHFALTYPQCNLGAANVADHFFQKLECELVVVCHEYHQDGGDHLHAYIGLKKRQNIRKADFFDIEGFHPNVQSCRSISNWIKYVKKDGDFVVRGDESKLKSAETK